MILGLSGKALSGKDTTADYLIDKHGWYGKTALAENLKRACMRIFGLSENQVFSQSGKSSKLTPPIKITYSDVYDIISWMRKTHSVSIYDKTVADLDNKFVGRVLKTPRDILQFVGTDIMRYFVPDYHVEVIFRSIPTEKNFIITDIRFPNEAKVVLDNGGYLVRIKRDFSLRSENGVKIDTNHLSETALDSWSEWSYVLNNNTNSLDTLYKDIDNMVGDIKNAVRLPNNKKAV